MSNSPHHEDFEDIDYDPHYYERLDAEKREKAKTAKRKKNSRTAVVLGVVLIVFGLTYTHDQGLQNNEKVTTGNIVHLDVSEHQTKKGRIIRSDKTITVCKPTAQFTINDTVYSAKLSRQIDSCPWEMNQKVEIFYDETNPENSRIAPEEKMETLAIVLPVGGIALILFGLRSFIARTVPTKKLLAFINR